jgi:hypothetical protein
MATTRTIHDLLRQKEADLARLQTEVQALRIASDLLADARSDRKTEVSPTDNRRADSNSSGGTSQSEMIQAVLSEANKPMKLADIAAGIRVKFNKEVKENNLSSLIYRNIKSPQPIFRKEPQPNTFALVGWPTTIGRENPLFENGRPIDAR